MTNEENLKATTENSSCNLFLTSNELSKILKVAPGTIRSWLHKGIFPKRTYFKISVSKKSTLRFYKEPVLDWFYKLSEGGTENASA